MVSALTSLSPIPVCGKVLPTVQLFENIPMLHRILNEVFEDWRRAVAPYQKKIDSAEDDSAALHPIVSGFMDLQPVFLKCLFSYAFFFVAADQAYAHFYKELNQANHLSGLKRTHGKPPKKTPFVKKIQLIRDTSIAHFPSKKKVDSITACAAMSWTPMALSSAHGARPDIENLTFCPGQFRGIDASGQSTQSQDLEFSFGTAHQHCLPYLDQYDEVCCKYLRDLHHAIGT